MVLKKQKTMSFYKIWSRGWKIFIFVLLVSGGLLFLNYHQTRAACAPGEASLPLQPVTSNCSSGTQMINFTNSCESYEACDVQACRICAPTQADLLLGINSRTDCDAAVRTVLSSTVVRDRAICVLNPTDPLCVGYAPSFCGECQNNAQCFNNNPSCTARCITGGSNGNYCSVSCPAISVNGLPVDTETGTNSRYSCNSSVGICSIDPNGSYADINSCATNCLPPKNFDITSTASQTVQRGGTASYAVTLRGTDNYSGPVTVTTNNCPTGSSCTFTCANSYDCFGTPTNNSATVYVTPVQGTLIYYNITTSAATPLYPVGSPYNITFTGTISGGPTKSANSALYVNSLPSDPPTVVIDLPANGATISGNNVQIAGWAIDNTIRAETAISSIKIEVIDSFGTVRYMQTLGQLNYTNRSDVCGMYPNRPKCPDVGYSHPFDSTAVANGVYTIRVTATDEDTPPKTAYAERSVNISNSVSSLNVTCSDCAFSAYSGDPSSLTPSSGTLRITNNGGQPANWRVQTVGVTWCKINGLPRNSASLSSSQPLQPGSSIDLSVTVDGTNVMPLGESDCIVVIFNTTSGDQLPDKIVRYNVKSCLDKIASKPSGGYCGGVGPGSYTAMWNAPGTQSSIGEYYFRAGLNSDATEVNNGCPSWTGGTCVNKSGNLSQTTNTFSVPDPTKFPLTPNTTYLNRVPIVCAQINDDSAGGRATSVYNVTWTCNTAAPVCSNNGQCSDGNSCTTDTCNFPGTANASCSSQVTPGFYSTCENNACVAKPNTAATCAANTAQCASNANCCKPATTGTISASPSSLTPGQTFTVTCDFGSEKDFIPAPTVNGTSCIYKGFLNPPQVGHIGSQTLFQCTAPNTPGTYPVSCQPANLNPPGNYFTYFCSQPAAVSTNVTVNSVCVDPATRTGTISTSLVGNEAYPSQQFDLYCNYGSNTDYIQVTGTGSAGCAYIDHSGSTAHYRCPAPASAGNYSITCQGVDYPDPYYTDFCSPTTPVTYNYAVTNAGVDLKCNSGSGASDGPCIVNSGGSVTLSWTTSGSPTTCTAGGDWSGSKSIGGSSEVITNILSGKTYSLTCSKTNSTATDTVIVNVNQDFSLDISEASKTIQQGQSTTYTLTLTSLYNFAGTVTLAAISGCPSGATCSYSGGNTATLNAGGTATKIITVTSAISTPVGTVNLTSTGTATINGSPVSHSDSASLVVNALPALSCPSPAPAVILSTNSILATETSTASAPAGFSGGSFTSSNTGVATVSGTTVTGVSGGTSNITGSGWTYTSGSQSANGCTLAASALTVRPQNPGCVGPSCNGGGGGGFSASVASCSLINLSWTAASGATSYNIYRHTANDSAAATLIASNVAALSYADSGVSGGTVYFYWVEGAGGGQVSPSRVAASNNLSGGVSPPTCNASLSSDKDIVAVNGTNYSTSDCSGGNESPSNLSYVAGDKIKFAINLCNSALASANATNIVVTDSLTNLERVDKNYPTNDIRAWNMTFQNLPNNPSLTVSGSEPNSLVLTLTFIGSSIAPGGGGKIFLEARPAVPAGFTSPSSRFQNRASTTYTRNSSGATGTVSANTPLLIFSSSRTPTKIETSAGR